MSLKIELLSLLSNDLLTIIGDLLGGRLPETENKRICQISGLKSEWWSLTRELLK